MRPLTAQHTGHREEPLLVERAHLRLGEKVRPHPEFGE